LIEEADRLAKEGAIEVPPIQTAVISFSVSENHTKRHLELEQQTARDAWTAGRQFNTLLRYPLPSRANELLAMGRLRLMAAVGLLTGHTTLRAHLYTLEHAERQECRLCGYEKEDSVHTVCHCPVLACKIYRISGCMLLKPEDLDKLRVGSLLSLVANTGLGLVS
jgi:predicted Zn-ribbon and HTH transcriptional regulator